MRKLKLLWIVLAGIVLLGGSVTAVLVILHHRHARETADEKRFADVHTYIHTVGRVRSGAVTFSDAYQRMIDVFAGEYECAETQTGGGVYMRLILKPDLSADLIRCEYGRISKPPRLYDPKKIEIPLWFPCRNDVYLFFTDATKLPYGTLRAMFLDPWDWQKSCWVGESENSGFYPYNTNYAVRLLDVGEGGRRAAYSERHMFFRRSYLDESRAMVDAQTN